jgi:cell wall-associated NlpC family hydrolase
MKQQMFLNYLLMFIGTPYKLGGNVTQDGGIDCSGLVLEGLRSIGKWGKGDDTAQGIFNKFKNQTKLKDMYAPGRLLFFGESSEKITHIAVCLNDYQMIEAGGTDKDGMVRIRPLSWRSDMIAILDIF